MKGDGKREKGKGKDAPIVGSALKPL